jgi:adenylate cyclase
MPYRTIVQEAQRAFPCPPEALWGALANTDHLNRWMGLPPVAFGPLTITPEALYREASARLGGFLRFAWREYPFEWVRDERYAVMRLFEPGPLNMTYGGVEIRRDGDQSRVRVFAEITPRTAMGWALARQLARKGLRDVMAYCDRFASLRASGLEVNLPSLSRVTPTDPTLLRQLLESLRQNGISEAILARFRRHVTTASDAEVLRMQPYGLADTWGANRSEVLRLLVHAERQGAIYRTWEVMCPNCRVATTRATSLASVPARFHCDGCGIAYDADLEQWVELRFAVHAGLRRAGHEVHCLGGPANTPHIWAQQYLLPGTERAFAISLPDDAFRVRALRLNVACPLEPDAAAASAVAFTYGEDGWVQIRQPFRPGTVTVRLRNEAPHVVVAVLERVRPDPRAITAAQVLTGTDLREVRELDMPDGAVPR